jgi:hypothetical protein
MSKIPDLEVVGLVHLLSLTAEVARITVPVKRIVEGLNIIIFERFYPVND